MDMKKAAALEKGDLFTLPGSESVYKFTREFDGMNATLRCRHAPDVSTEICISKESDVHFLSSADCFNHSHHQGWIALEEARRQKEKFNKKIGLVALPLVFLSFLYVLAMSIRIAGGVVAYFKILLICSPILFATLYALHSSDKAKTSMEKFRGLCLSFIILVGGFALEFWQHDVLFNLLYR